MQKSCYLFCVFLILAGTLSFAQKIKQSNPCLNFKISKVYILKKEMNDEANHKGCFSEDSPCYVNIKTTQGITRRFRFLLPSTDTDEHIGYSSQCEGANLDSHGSIADLVLPKGCNISINFPVAKTGDPVTVCDCSASICKKHEEQIHPTSNRSEKSKNSDTTP